MDIQENKSININDIARIVAKNNKMFAYDLWIPSLNRTTKFEEINTSQQKRLIKSLLDESIYNTEFTDTFKEILKENCVDTEIDIGSLTIFDKLVLGIGMRINSIGPIIETNINIDSEEGKKIPTKVEINLKEIYDNIQTTINLNAFKSLVISNPNYSFSLKCDLPTIQTESIVNKELKKLEKNNSSNKVAQSISTAFVGELIKYVQDAEIIEDGARRNIGWEKLSFNDKKTIVEMFNSHLLKDIVKYIDDIKTEFNKIDLFKFEINGKTYEQRLVLDGNFFMIS